VPEARRTKQVVISATTATTSVCDCSLEPYISRWVTVPPCQAGCSPEAGEVTENLARPCSAANYHPAIRLAYGLHR